MNPFDVSAGLSISFDLGYHRAKNLKHYPEFENRTANVWGIWNIDVGYRYEEKRWGISLNANRFKGTAQTIGPADGIVYYDIERTTIAFLSKIVFIGTPRSNRVNLEVGPCLNIQYTDNPRYQRMDEKKDPSLGVIIGAGLVIPKRFTNLLLRVRYILVRDYRGYNTSGIGITLGIGWGKI